MKGKILLTLLIIGFGITLFITGCKKDDSTATVDSTAPVITLIGATSIELSLNSAAWTDLGATATDDKDGSVTVSSDASSTNPNTNLVGTYTITYTATDAAGNTRSAIRTIRVKNDAENFAGNYNVHDTVPGVFIQPYTQVISVDNTLNLRVHFSRFGDYANNTGIYATKLGNGKLEIPSQTAADIGTGTAAACQVTTHLFSSISFIITTNGFVLQYNDAITAPSPCVSSTQGTATYTKQ